MMKLPAAACALGALVLLATIVRGEEAPAPAAGIAESLGVRPAPQPVRERAGWRAPKLILVNARLHEQMNALRAAAPGVTFVDGDAATAAQVAKADATIGICTPEVLSGATHLQWIQWLGAGVEGCVQQPKLRERGVLLTNMQSAAGPSMAEHVMGMMLVLSRHLDYYLKQQEQGRWADDAPALADLSGKTVLIVGLGGIGTEVAKRAHAFGMRITATRASGRNGPDYVSYVGLPDELLKLAPAADFVVNCSPLTPQTAGLFNAGFFAAMKPGAYFLNVGRGRSVITADLIAALTAGRLAGAGLDVVDPEPLPASSPLWHLPNVIITPHISAATPMADSQRALLLRENLRRYVAGEPMLAVVDIDRGY
ncbi:MAG: D-2-hydroxyacid dehydrogenase [Proteobacteria bacterium]|nr:D-2-hydroxyacid dehydrogenase [Pseudomonadota bacterium]